MMEIVLPLQTDPHLPWYVNRYGCNYMSLIHIPVIELGRLLRLRELSLAYFDLWQMGAMSETCRVKDPHEIINLGFQLLGDFGRRGTQIGIRDQDDTDYWAWLATYPEYKRVDYTVLKATTANGNDHFRLGDKDGNLIYDPDPTVQIIAEQHQLLYHVYES